MNLRRTLLVGAAALVLLVGALVAAALLIPEERVARALADRAQAVLGQPVQIERAGIRIFPLPGVHLSGIRVGPPDSTAIAAVDEVEVRVRLFPLFRGEVVVDQLGLVRPRVLLAIDSAGASNLPALTGDSAAPAPEPAPARDVAFSIDRLNVQDGRLAYTDARDGTAIRLDGWDQRLRLSGAIRAGELSEVELGGWVSFDDVDTRLPDVVIPAHDLRIRLTHDAVLDRTADRLAIRDLTLALNGVTLSGAGAVEALSDPATRSADLQLAAEGIDAAELLTWAPAELRQRLALGDGRAIALNGLASMRVDVRGRLAPDTLPAFDGTLTLIDAGASVEGEPLVSDVRGEAAFSADSLVARLNGDLVGEGFAAAVALRDPRNPALAVALDARLELDPLAQLGLLPDTLGLTGAARADVNVALPLQRPAGARSTGTIQLSDIRLGGMDPAVAIPAATVTLEGGELRIQPLAMRLGDDVEARLDLLISGWIPALVDSTAAPPRVVALLEADTVDLDRLLGPSQSQYPPLLFARLRDQTLEGRSAAEAAAETGLALPEIPAINADVRVQIDRLIRNGLAYQDLDASLEVTEGRIEVTDARFGLMGGTVVASGRLEQTQAEADGPPQALLVGEYQLENVGAEAFFDRLTPFRDHLAGRMAMQGTFAVVLDSTVLPEPGSLQAGGTITMEQGRLANWQVLEALASRLGVAAFDTLRFQDWAGVFGVTGNRVTLDETVLDGQSLDLRAAGSFDLSGGLDLGATVYLEPELAARAGALRQQLAVLADDDGRVPIGIRIGGTAQEPAIQLDLSEARSNVVARAREAAQEQGRELADRAAREALQRLELPDSLLTLPADSLRTVIGDSLFGLLPDSARARGDSLRAAAEQALRNRIRRLLPPGGGGFR